MLDSERRFIMSYSNYRLKYTECNVCGHDADCFLQYEYGFARAVCSDCLYNADRFMHDD